METKPNHPPDESDPRFPSESWIGFWIQRSMGKQATSIAFRFSDGKISGEGRDIVGKFTFSGTYDLNSGRCLMTKQYLGAHQVHYEGVCEGRDLWLWGMWNIRHHRGGFHLWPEGEPDPTQKRLREEIDIPFHAETEARIPAEIFPF